MYSHVLFPLKSKQPSSASKIASSDEPLKMPSNIKAIPIKVVMFFSFPLRACDLFIPGNLPFLKLGLWRAPFAFIDKCRFYISFWMTNLGMLSMRRTKFQVFNSVIFFIMIFMVNYLVGQKIAAKMLFHYKSVLSKISHLLMVRMIPFFNVSIATPIHSSTFPTRRLFAKKVGRLMSALFQPSTYGLPVLGRS